ncbi:hypothetical protein BKA62DRAFT_201104 [Auriculariales sp. MPI-PUGE-AT-0066]|nr:hypothetical protein BKA62DRAFT_201104 [Auriculariales sp. MPI-PUGE-AT-0066]
MIIIEPLPLYSSSDPSPDYTAVAGVREVTVEAAWHSELPGVEIRTRGTRNIVRSYKSKMVAFSVVFQHQQADAGQVPAYCQDDAVTGFIRIHDARASKITCISISLEGEVELGLAGKSPRSFTNTTFDLWTADDVHSVPPNIHNFTIPFPQTIEDRNKVERALPSSIKLSTRAGLAAEIRYAFTVRVTVQTFRGMTRKIHRYVYKRDCTFSR